MGNTIRSFTSLKYLGIIFLFLQFLFMHENDWQVIHETGSPPISKANTTNGVRNVVSIKAAEHIPIVQAPLPLSNRSYWKGGRWQLSGEVTFFHLGKGGGGTVGALLKTYGINYRKCHPIPHYHLLEPPGLVLVNIRDPVDRFVSAFNWRTLLFCRPPSEETRQKNHRVAQRPYDYCFKRTKGDGDLVSEVDILHNIYAKDVNRMAEAFCRDNQDQQATTTKHPRDGNTSTIVVLGRAYEHAQTVIHGKFRLTEWLKGLYDTKEFPPIPQQQHQARLVGLVMERLNQTIHVRFEDQIVRAIVEILDAYSAVDPEHTNPTPGVVEKVTEQQTEAMHHSSSKSNDILKPAKVTPYSECCLARYYLSQDYAILDAIVQNHFGQPKVPSKLHLSASLQNLCKWGHPINQLLCIESIRSMVGRRAKYLQRDSAGRYSSTCRQAAVAAG